MNHPHLERRHFLTAALALGASSLARPLWAQTAGQEFILLNPAQPTESAGKIEVLEFFSYGCPHCADFNPLLSLWADKLPADVVLKKVPVSFGRAAWGNAAKLYYALQTTGDLQRLENKVFQAIHKDRTNLFEEKSIKSWVAANGVNAQICRCFLLFRRAEQGPPWRSARTRLQDRRRSRPCRQWQIPDRHPAVRTATGSGRQIDCAGAPHHG